MRTVLSRLPVSLQNDAFRLTCDYASPWYKQGMGFPCVEGALELARRSGFQPAAIVDVGAYIGNWSRMAQAIFPSASIVMVDANPENEGALAVAAKSMGNNTKRFIALLGPERREKVTLFQNQTGTSVLRELTSYKAKQVDTPMCTLDELLAQEGLAEPLLLKLDVQGFELEVLRGSGRILGASELVVLEVSTLPFNEGAPLFAEVIHFMAEHGFDVFDFCGQARRDSDNALFQIDVLFANRNSRLRQPRQFFLEEAEHLSSTR